MDLAAVDLAQLLEKLESWLGAIVVMAPNVLLALLIVGAGATGSRRLQRVVQSIVRRVTGNEPISRLLGKASRISAIVLACLWALALLHLDRTVTSLLAGVGVIGLALGFAFQDIAANFMSGFIMAMNRPFDCLRARSLSGR
jgi:small conductance mechanosensitive channel